MVCSVQVRSGRERTSSWISAGRVREQDQADAGGVQREVVTYAGEHGDRTAAGQPLDEHRLALLAHGQLHVLPGGDEEVLHVGEGDLAESEAARGQRSDLPQPEADLDPAGTGALQCPQATRSVTIRCVVVSGRPLSRLISCSVRVGWSGVNVASTSSERSVSDMPVSSQPASSGRSRRDLSSSTVVPNVAVTTTPSAVRSKVAKSV